MMLKCVAFLVILCILCGCSQEQPKQLESSYIQDSSSQEDTSESQYVVKTEAEAIEIAQEKSGLSKAQYIYAAKEGSGAPDYYFVHISTHSKREPIDSNSVFFLKSYCINRITGGTEDHFPYFGTGQYLNHVDVKLSFEDVLQIIKKDQNHENEPRYFYLISLSPVDVTQKDQQPYFVVLERYIYGPVIDSDSDEVIAIGTYHVDANTGEVTVIEQRDPDTILQSLDR